MGVRCRQAGGRSPSLPHSPPSSRHPVSWIGGGAVLVPGVEEAFVAAGAVVVADVAPRSVVMGVPASHVREVPDEDLLGRFT